MIVNQTLRHVVEQSGRCEITTDMIVEAEERERLVKQIIEYQWEMEDRYFEDDDDDFCDCCGDDLSLGYPDGDGCPMCLSCGGSYAPGTEECDWCPHSDECGNDWVERFGKSTNAATTTAEIGQENLIMYDYNNLVNSTRQSFATFTRGLPM